jgi:lysophospholipase L1-like esterase
MPQDTRSRPRRSRLGLFLFLIVLADLALEVIVLAGVSLPFRTIGQALWAGWTGSGSELTDIMYEAQPYVTYGLTPDFERRRQDESVPVRTTNSHGFRGPEIPVAKPDGTVRVLCLGGSTTYSDAVSDDETYPFLLERVLREARPGVSIDVINGGVPSYTSAESLANLAFRGLEFEPDVLVIYHAANDVRPRRYADFEPSYFHYRKPWDGSDRLEEKVPGTDMAGGINTLIQWAPPEDNGDPRVNLQDSGPEAFRRNLVSMIGVARAHGIQPVLVTFAAKGPDPVTEPGLLDGIAQHNRIIGEVAAEYAVTLVDLDGKLSRDGTFASVGTTLDPVHLNPTGTLQKAQIIAEGVLPLIR